MINEYPHGIRFLIARGAWSLGLSIPQTVKIFEDLKTKDFDEKITCFQLKHIFKEWKNEELK